MLDQLRINFFIICLVAIIISWCCGNVIGGTTQDTMHPLNAVERKEFLNRVQKLQAEIRTVQADFVEKRNVSSLKTPLHFSGKLFYSRSGLFFMEYTSPFSYILRVKGKEALFYVKGSQTADVVDISSAEGLAQHPDFFSWNPDAFKGKVLDDHQNYCLQETTQGVGGAKNNGRGLTIFLDRNTLFVKQLRIEDGDDVTEITLSSVQVNRALPQEVLTFTLPQGIKLNRLNQP